MGRIVSINEDIRIISSAAVGGREEGRGALGEYFDLIDETDLFNMKNYEDAEGEMSRLSLNLALNKLNLSYKELDLVAGGDLQNQCIATSNALLSLGVPFLGLYGACSTCTEALLTLSAFMSSSKEINLTAAISSSHNSAAERQFRMPLEYGGQRPPTAQWTSTAAASFILAKGGQGVRIREFMVGKIVDGAIRDGANMGAAMSFAAFDTIRDYFRESGKSHRDFDYIVTGDLGKVGSSLLRDILSKDIHGFERFHTDCGLILYDFKEKDAHSGASGCGTSASVLSSHFLPLLEKGDIKRILFLSTGALMNPTSLLQGEDIYGIAPLLKIERI
jgi:stage V sporulation protein AD